MKENSWLELSIRGMGIGFPVTLLCMTLIGGYNSVVRELLIWMIASALFGLISGAVFIKGNFNMIAATAVHCLGCLVVAAGAATLCGYAESFLEVLLAILPVFLAVYAVIYLCVCLVMKYEEKRINRELSK